MAENSFKKKNINIETENDFNGKAETADPVETDTPLKTSQTEKTETTGQLKEQLEAAHQEISQGQEKLLRLSAEVENYKKRMNRQMDEFRKYANEALLKDLLSVVDNLERALTTSEKDIGKMAPASFIEGVEMTLA